MASAGGSAGAAYDPMPNSVGAALVPLGGHVTASPPPGSGLAREWRPGQPRPSPPYICTTDEQRQQEVARQHARLEYDKTHNMDGSLKRKRGRPPKAVTEEKRRLEAEEAAAAALSPSPSQAVKRPRGRPPKNARTDAAAAAAVAVGANRISAAPSVPAHSPGTLMKVSQAKRPRGRPPKGSSPPPPAPPQSRKSAKAKQPAAAGAGGYQKSHKATSAQRKELVHAALQRLVQDDRFVSLVAAELDGAL